MAKGRADMGRKIDLDGKTWLNYSISVWDDVRKSAEESALSHPALFPVQLAKRLISVFSYPGETVLDPFCGTGTTLMAAHQLGRRGVGLDISTEFLELTKSRLTEAEYNDYTLLQGDARHVDQLISGLVDLCITSPPYWDILNQKRTADHKDIRHYGNFNDDLGIIEGYEEFILALGDVFGGVYHLLRDKGYCCVVVMDLRKKNQFYPLHMDLTRKMEQIGFTLDDIIVWDRRQEYNRLRPLGFPYVFRINRIHEYILIFQKRK
jgi:DNA modification methylase